MTHYEVIKEYQNNQLDSIENVLKKANELLAFIRVYGSIYNDNYFAYILNLNNVIEHYLKNLNSDVIDKLYCLFSSLKESNKSEKEILQELLIILSKLPVPAIVEISDRSARHKIR